MRDELDRRVIPEVESLASELDATAGHAVWDRNEWALIRGASFAWLLTRRIPDRPLPFVDPQSSAQAQYWLGGLTETQRVPTPLDPEWHAATLTAEARIAELVEQLRDGRSGLRLMSGSEREVIVADELCALSPVPPRDGCPPTISARRGNAAFAALVRRVHEGTVDEALEPLPVGYLAQALARGVVYGPQIATLSDGTRTVGRLPERR